MRNAKQVTKKRSQWKETAISNGNAWKVLEWMEDAMYGLDAGFKPVRVRGSLHTVLW